MEVPLAIWSWRDGCKQERTVVGDYEDKGKVQRRHFQNPETQSEQEALRHHRPETTLLMSTTCSGTSGILGAGRRGQRANDVRLPPYCFLLQVCCLLQDQFLAIVNTMVTDAPSPFHDMDSPFTRRFKGATNQVDMAHAEVPQE